MVCALVRGSTRDNRRRWRGQKPLIFMRFHGVFLGSQHEIWSKQYNGKVRKVRLSVSNAVHSLAVLVARDEGLFRDQGLDVEIVRTPGSAHVDTDRQAVRDAIFE